MTELEALSQAQIQLSNSVRALSDTASRIDERIKDLYEHYKTLTEEAAWAKKAYAEIMTKLAIVDSFLSKNVADRIIRLEEEHKAYMHEYIERTAALDESAKEVRAIIRDGHGTMPSVLARLIMIENSSKRLTEIATENRNLIEQNISTVRAVEAKLIRVDWDQQSVQGKIGIVVNLIWKIAIPIVGAYIVWKLGLR